MKILSKTAITVALLIVSGHTSAAPARATPSLDTVSRVTASVTDSIDAVAEKFRGPLLTKKAELEIKISDLQQQENAVVQSGIGAQINAATNSTTVKATRPLGTPGETLARIGWQLYRAVVIAALFILDHKMILYLLLALILYKIIRSLFRRVFTSQS